MKEEQEQMLDELRLDIAFKLVEIWDIIKARGLVGITKLTLLARDPRDENMYTCVSNEPQEIIDAIIGTVLGDAVEKHK